MMIKKHKLNFLVIYVFAGLFLFLLNGCVRDNIPDPVVTLIGDLEITIEAGSDYMDQGATAIYDENPIDVTIVNHVDTTHVGTYTNEYCVMIDDECKGSIERIIHVIDTTSPEISLTISSPIIIEYGSGFTLMDFVDVIENHDSLEEMTWTFSKPIDYDTLGTYRIYFSVTDQSNNKSNTITCTIIIEDNESPVISFQGDDPVIMEAGIDLLPVDRFQFLDNYDDIDSIELVIQNDQPLIIGEQSVNVVAIDSSGNQSIPIEIPLILTDETAPILAFSPLDDFIHEIGFPYTEDYLTLYDNFDSFENIQLFTSGEVDYMTKGDYEMSYYAIDSNGNMSSTITKTVHVVDKDDSLSDIERYLKDHTSLYDVNKFVNQYLYDPMEQCYRGLILNHQGTYDVVYFFFLYNFQDNIHVLRKIEFVNPYGSNLVFTLDDETHEYVFSIPLEFAKDTGQITIYTYPHEEYQATVSSWTGIFSFNGLQNLNPTHLLGLDLKKGNLK